MEPQQESAPDPGTGPAPPAPQMSKNAAKRAARKAAAKARKASAKAAVDEAGAAPVALTIDDIPPCTYPDLLREGVDIGCLPLHQSQFGTLGIRWADIAKLPALLAAADPDAPPVHVWIRAQLQSTRRQGFMVLRQSCHTVQVYIPKSYAGRRLVTRIPAESLVVVHVLLRAAEQMVVSCTVSSVELELAKCFLAAPSEPLPFSVLEANRATDYPGQPAGAAAGPDGTPDTADGTPGAQRKTVLVHQATRLDYRYIDLRTPVNQAIFRIRARVARAFRDFLLERDFVEIHSPKMIATASEGGADVFRVDYLGGRTAYLAQSPQLYKQMAVVSGFRRVFEIGPVFRAEQSNTNRHLTEFTGLDLEMEIGEHYHEVLRLLWDLFRHIFADVYCHCRTEVDTVQKVYPVPDMVLKEEPVILKYTDAVAHLESVGAYTPPAEDVQGAHDINAEQEQILGRWVREQHGTDFYILDKYPVSARPFYTMPSPVSEGADAAGAPLWTNSYDIFVRGQEIASGAQRIHDAKMLTDPTRSGLRLKGASGTGPDDLVDLTPIQAYVDSFRHGSVPHGGAGIGLERVVMLMLGLPRVKLASLFPRDPSRLTP